MESTVVSSKPAAEPLLSSKLLDTAGAAHKLNQAHHLQAAALCVGAHKSLERQLKSLADKKLAAARASPSGDKPPKVVFSGANGKLSSSSGSSSSMCSQQHTEVGNKCGKCQNHEVEVSKKGHARECPFKKCDCLKCRLLDARSDILQVISGKETKLKGTKKDPNCGFCQNHGVKILRKGHVRSCGFGQERHFTLDNCFDCEVHYIRNEVNRLQIKMRRAMKEDRTLSEEQRKTAREAITRDEVEKVCDMARVARRKRESILSRQASASQEVATSAIAAHSQIIQQQQQQLNQQFVEAVWRPWAQQLAQQQQQQHQAAPPPPPLPVQQPQLIQVQQHQPPPQQQQQMSALDDDSSPMANVNMVDCYDPLMANLDNDGLVNCALQGGHTRSPSPAFGYHHRQQQHQAAPSAADELLREKQHKQQLQRQLFRNNMGDHFGGHQTICQPTGELAGASDQFSEPGEAAPPALVAPAVVAQRTNAAAAQQQQQQEQQLLQFFQLIVAQFAHSGARP